LILAGWGLSALATLGMALAPDWRWFIPALTVYLLSNFAVPALQGYIAAGESPRTISRVFSIIASGNSLGSVIAPAIGGWIGETFSLRTVYFCAAVVFALDTVFVLARLSAQPVPASGAPRAAAWQVLSKRAFLIEIVFIFLLFLAIDLGQVMAPKFLAEVRGLTVSQIGWLGSIGTLGVVGLTLALGRLPAERRTPLLISQAVALVALLIWLAVPGLLATGLAYFIHGSNRVIRPITASRLSAALDPDTMSFGFGFYQTAQQLGLTISPYAAGLLYAQDPAWPLFAGALAICVMMLVTLRLPKAVAPRIVEEPV
jgi:predicted MFS family arabinose efflux permease